MVPMLPAKSMTHSKSFLDRLQRVEKHLRKNKLKLTLTQRLGNAQDEDEVINIKPCQSLSFQAPVSQIWYIQCGQEPIKQQHKRNISPLPWSCSEPLAMLCRFRAKQKQRS